MAKNVKKNGHAKRVRGIPKEKSPEHVARSRAIFALLRAVKGLKASEIAKGATYNDGTGRKQICLATIYNLRRVDGTRYPRFQTMEAVAHSAGYGYLLTRVNEPQE